MLNNYVVIKNDGVIYFQTLKEVPWHIGLIKLENWQNSEEAWKTIWKLM